MRYERQKIGLTEEKRKEIEARKKFLSEAVESIQRDGRLISEREGFIFRDDREKKLWSGRRRARRLLSLDIGRVPARGFGVTAYKATIHLNLTKIAGEINPRKTVYLELYRKGKTGSHILIKRQFALCDLLDFVTWASWIGDINRGVIYNPDTGVFEPRYHKVQAFNRELWEYYANRFPEFKIKPKT